MNGSLRSDQETSRGLPWERATHSVRTDLLWLVGLGLVLIGVGLGLRDPWPADEPRFALIARDMVRFHDWLFPQVGSDLYSDKPPLFFWFIAAFYWLTGSLRVAFLLPSLLASIACVVLVYDIARRLWNREAAFAGAWCLLITFQFVWQGRQAQIDAVLCFWTTLSLYALLRFLLVERAWGWYALGCAAAGFGVITKGVGFLPLLLLPIFFVMRRFGWQGASAERRGHAGWLVGPVAFLVAVAVWLVPMLIFANTPELHTYRNDILFHQTVDRYAASWHHREPVWYFVVQVIPPLWLPLSALCFWLWPHWRSHFRAKDLRSALPLLWVIAVVVFFSASPGKRGVYVLPALPALAIAAAPGLPDVLDRRGVRRLLWILAASLAAVPLLGAIYLLFAAKARSDLLAQYGFDPLPIFLTMGVAATAVCVMFRERHARSAYTYALGILLVIVGLWVNPALNGDRSSRNFVTKVEAAAAPFNELGLVGYKEQYLLEFTRPTFNFGHARWRESELEVADAAAWMSAKSGRALLIPASERDRCFGSAGQSLGVANGAEWFLVVEGASPSCIARGNVGAARVYAPPGLATRN